MNEEELTKIAIEYVTGVEHPHLGQPSLPLDGLDPVVRLWLIDAIVITSYNRGFNDGSEWGWGAKSSDTYTDVPLPPFPTPHTENNHEHYIGR